MSTNDTLAAMFTRMAAVMDIKGENKFKSIAFAKVGRILGDLPTDVKSLVADGTLKDVEGIGDSSRKIIEQFVKSGKSEDYDDLTGSIPAGLLEMVDIPGLGPKTVALLWKEKGITSVAALTKAIEAGSLVGLKGIGDKKIEQIQQGIAIKAASVGRRGIVEVAEVAEHFLARVRAMLHVEHCELAGSYRRRRETVGDVDVVACLKPGVPSSVQAKVVSEFVKDPLVDKILGEGATKGSVLLKNGLQVDLRIVPSTSFGAALMYFTGSKDHNVKMRSRAQERGMTLNEWGLYRSQDYDKASKKSGEAPDCKAVASADEAEVFAALDLAFVPPEMREDRGEVEQAASAGPKGKMARLIEVGDIRGDLHTHTTASDGANTIEEMALAAKAKGYAFLAITDHSKSQVIANGLDEKRLLAHVAAIRKVAEKVKGIRLLAGCEVDILSDGRLDFDETILKELDIVVASPHVSLRQDEEKATARILRAIETRYVNIIGHPTGRLINQRDGLPLDFAKVFKAAASAGVALEINAGWPRLDLNDVRARSAVEAGCVLSINTDAHSTGMLDGMGLGVSVARRGWVEAGKVINCWEWGKLDGWLGTKR